MSMKVIKEYNLALVLVLPMVSVVFLSTLTAYGQERTTTTDSLDADVERATDYNSNRSSQSAAAEQGEVNVCDGVTCADGSCAATREECPVSATISPDVYADEDVEHRRGDEVDIIGIGDERTQEDAAQAVERAQTHNSSRSNETQGRAGSDVDGDGRPDVLDPDDDGDGVPTRIEHTTTQTDQAGTGVGSSNEDMLDEDDDVIEPAQDYNSTRSNRRKNEFFDPEDDEVEDDDANVLTVRHDRLLDARNRLRDMRCGSVAARSDDGSLWCWGQGVRAAAVGDSADDGTVATSSRVLRYLSVRGDDVRSWSERERAEFARYRELMGEENEPEALTADIASLVLGNERVGDLEVNEQETRLTYRAQLRLFGFIPIEREVTARAAALDTIEIDYPWYAIVATTPDTDTINSLFSSLATAIAARGGGAGKVTLSDF